MNRSVCGAWILVAVAGLTAHAEAGRVYLSGNGGVEPWGSTNNTTAMNTAFGAGNWSRMDFGTAVAGGLFSNEFIFIDGGDGVDAQFVGFLNANRTALENWVAGGGKLVMNAATWFQPTINLGFGATSTQAFDNGRSTGTAVNAAHPIFNGPNGVTGTSFSGYYFAHNDITGPGFTAVMRDGFDRDILVERTWGSGLVMLGGLTTPNHHGPGAAALALRANMLDYVDGFQTLVLIPLPTGAAMGMAGMGLLAIRRRGVR
jgi:hypothetical protein